MANGCKGGGWLAKLPQEYHGNQSKWQKRQDMFPKIHSRPTDLN